MRVFTYLLVYSFSMISAFAIWPPLKNKYFGTFSPSQLEIIQTLTNLGKVQPDFSNEFDLNKDAYAFGRALFHDVRLSPHGISCAHCHSQKDSLGDGKRLAEGTKRLSRHAPSLWNIGFQRWFFWDGRADSVWAQAQGPIEHPDEMGSHRLYVFQVLLENPDLHSLLNRVSPETLKLDSQLPKTTFLQPNNFEYIWSQLDLDDKKRINNVFSVVIKSLSAFQRYKFVSNNSKFDKFARGINDGNGWHHLSKSQRNGLKVFLTKGQCTMCHHGGNFSDGEFHNLGLLPDPALGIDRGRFAAIDKVKTHEFNSLSSYANPHPGHKLINYLVKTPEQLGQFKTPTLRNIAKTAPYMHDGRFNQLSEVIEFYSTLPDRVLVGHREENLTARNLTKKEVQDLVNFLHSLTDESIFSSSVSR